MDDKWAKKLKNKLDGYAEPLPPAGWERLEQELDAPNVVPMWRRAGRIAAVLTLLVATSVAVWLFSTRLPHSDYSYPSGPGGVINDAAIASYVQPVEAETESPVKVVLEELQGSKTVLKNAWVVQYTRETLPHLYHSEREDAAEMIICAESLDEPEATVEENKTPERETRKYVRNSAQRKRDRAQMQRNAAHVKRAGHGRWTLGLQAGNMPYTDKKNLSGMQQLNTHVAYRYIDNGMASFQGLVNPKIWKSMQTHVKHRMPVGAGLNLRYALPHGWGVETGLSYTLLASEWQSDHGMNIEQKMHYLGIPLKVSKTLTDGKLFSLYASVGGGVERCVSARIHSENQEKHQSRSERLSVHQWQWLVSASLGAQLKMGKQVALFLEPGVAYYFDDGSNYETIRKEHPFNFNLQLGIRFNMVRR